VRRHKPPLRRERPKAVSGRPACVRAISRRMQKPYERAYVAGDKAEWKRTGRVVFYAVLADSKVAAAPHPLVQSEPQPLGPQ
jgi:hypothetical protein